MVSADLVILVGKVVCVTVRERVNPFEQRLDGRRSSPHGETCTYVRSYLSLPNSGSLSSVGLQPIHVHRAVHGVGCTVLSILQQSCGERKIVVVLVPAAKISLLSLSV